MRQLALGLVASLLASPAIACAQAPRIVVENLSGRLIREVSTTNRHVPPSGNLLPLDGPEQGLPPGQSATLYLPDCIGNRTIVIVFADGRRTELAFPGGIGPIPPIRVE